MKPIIKMIIGIWVIWIGIIFLSPYMIYVEADDQEPVSVSVVNATIGNSVSPGGTFSGNNTQDQTNAGLTFTSATLSGSYSGGTNVPPDTTNPNVWILGTKSHFSIVNNTGTTVFYNVQLLVFVNGSVTASVSTVTLNVPANSNAFFDLAANVSFGNSNLGKTVFFRWRVLESVITVQRDSPSVVLVAAPSAPTNTPVPPTATATHTFTPIPPGTPTPTPTNTATNTRTPTKTRTPTPVPIPYLQPIVSVSCSESNQIFIYITDPFGNIYGTGDSVLDFIYYEYTVGGVTHSNTDDDPIAYPIIIEGEAGANVLVQVYGVPHAGSGYTISPTGQGSTACPAPTNTPTATRTNTPTFTFTGVVPPSPTNTFTKTPTPTATHTPTPTWTHSPTATDTPTLEHGVPPSPSPTITHTYTPTNTFTHTPTFTYTATHTFTHTPVPGVPPTATRTPTSSPTGITPTPSPEIFPLTAFSAQYVQSNSNVVTQWNFNLNTLLDGLSNRVNIAYVTDNNGVFIAFNEQGLASPPIASTTDVSPVTAAMLFFGLRNESFFSLSRLNSDIASPLLFSNTYTFIARNEEVPGFFGRTTFWLKSVLVMPTVTPTHTSTFTPTPLNTPTPTPTPLPPLTGLILRIEDVLFGIEEDIN